MASLLFSDSTNYRTHARTAMRAVLVLTILLLCARSTRAQLTTSFYNLTSVETKTFSNALQITIRADGALVFGADFAEIIDTGEGRFAPRAVSSFRLRFLNARSKLPLSIPIGKYPLDSIAVTPGYAPFISPVFSGGGDTNLQTDLTFQFFTPVTVRLFEPNGYNYLPFGSYLNPLDVRISKGADPSTVTITILPDRTNTQTPAPPAEKPAALPDTSKSIIIIAPKGGETFRLEALHAPLYELLDAVSHETGTPLLADAGIAGERISLHLARADLASFLRALEASSDFVTTQEAEHIRIARGLPGVADPAAPFERIALQNLPADRIRSLFPDFLLPFLRADRENNSLLVFGSPQIIARVRRDVSTLDVPRALIRVEAAAWEIQTTRDSNTALQIQTTTGTTSLGLDTANGQFSLQIDKSSSRRLATTLRALSQQGRARLIARPSLVMASGESGSLFVGQTHFVPVLTNSGSGQNLDILRLAIGYALNVRPVSGAGEEISVEVNPRLSTVDELESGSGLPTIGLRETSSTMRVRSGDTILLGGIESDLQFDAKRQVFIRSKRSNRAQSSLLVMLHAAKIIEPHRRGDAEE